MSGMLLESAKKLIAREHEGFGTRNLRHNLADHECSFRVEVKGWVSRLARDNAQSMVRS